jgi:hypothetical protein
LNIALMRLLQHPPRTFQMPLAVLSVPRHLGDHLVEVHAHHRVAVDQSLELGEHRGQRELLTLGRYALPVTGQPRLKRILARRQPATLAPHVPSRGVDRRGSSRKGVRHGRQLSSVGVI